MHDIKYAKYNSSVGFRVVGGTAAQFLKADGSVDSTSYIADGTDINMADKNINFTTGSLSRFESNSRVFNKVYQRLLGTSQTGILSFKFPPPTTLATMFDVTIKMFGWGGRILGTVRVAFYRFSVTELNGNHKAIIKASDNFPSTVINMGVDASGKICINIGEPTTIWNSYLNVEVDRVVAFHQGANFDWSKGWSQTVETDVSTYSQLKPIATEVIATRSWVDANNAGSLPKAPTTLGSADLNTVLTPGFYLQVTNAGSIVTNNYPSEGLFAGNLKVYKTLLTGITQEYQTRRSGGNVTFIRSTEDNGATWSAWKKNLTNEDFSPSNYYTKSESLSQFVGKNGVETISDTKTFTHSPIVPNATLNGHAVNFGQLDWLLGQTVSNFIPLGFKGQPYGVAELDPNGKVPISQMPSHDGVKVNEEFSTLSGSGFYLSDYLLGGEVGLLDKEKNVLVAGKENNLYKFGSDYGGAGGVVVDIENAHMGYGGVMPTGSHNHYFNGTIRITGGIYSESANGAQVYATSGDLYQLDKDVSQEDGSLRLSVYDRVFNGMSNSFDTDQRIVKVLLMDGGTITMQNYFRYQEITVMNVSGNSANFTIDNTPVNVSISPKSSATFYVNGQNKIVLLRIDNDYCGVLN